MGRCIGNGISTFVGGFLSLAFTVWLCPGYIEGAGILVLWLGGNVAGAVAMWHLLAPQREE